MSVQMFINDTKDINLLQKKIKSLKLGFEGKKRLLENIGVEIESQIEERFERQNNVEGANWSDISEKTRLYYAKKSIGGSLLSRTRQLRDTIESQATANRLLVGATKIYAATHNYGDSRRNIPKREFIGLSSQNVIEIENIIEYFIKDFIEAGIK